ncbi:BNR repeat-containing protein [Reichenbachiella agariperforans]|nr:BNR repeat-containing protein [Reichenbachiella agariperforans]
MGILTLIVLLMLVSWSCVPNTKIVPVGEGWASNSINTPVFRKNSLYSFKGYQYISYYDAESHMVIGKRRLGTDDWELKTTRYKGNTSDAHNSISLIVDGEGYLHVSWDHHNSKLRYIKSTAPEKLEFGDELSMLDQKEEVVSYPEFYAMPSGDLLFFYRDGGSGDGNLIINRYVLADAQWTRLQENLISGEGQRNAYWQACVGQDGSIHVSWVWRESPDVASNHDMNYAQSTDGGLTWQKSDGTGYDLPITQTSAELIHPIPQNSELINQTSMATDPQGNPAIVSYWRSAGSDVPQYHVVYHRDDVWYTHDLGFRNETFSLSGTGTKFIPISRPQIVMDDEYATVVFRDAERGNKVSIARAPMADLGQWKLQDLTESGYPAWEPTLDPSLWLQNQELHLFLQDVMQVDGEGMAEAAAQMVQVLEWKI